MLEPRDEICSICGGCKDDHEILNHEFNLNNQLIPKDRSTPKRQPAGIPMVVGAIDIDLRRILLEKGIINNEDFTALRHPRTGTAGDRETGETSGS